MRDNYGLVAFYKALSAWEEHEKEWLSRIKEARQPMPSKSARESYRNVFIEGWLECYAENQEREAAGNATPE